MTKNQIASALAENKLFAGIPPAELAQIAALLHPRAFDKTERILEPGEPVAGVGILLHGSVQVSGEDYFGNRSLLAEINAPGIFGEVYTFTSAPSPVGVTAVTRGTVVFLPAAVIAEGNGISCHAHGILVANMMRILAKKNIILSEKITCLSARTLRGKLLAYLSLQAKQAGSSEFHVPFNREELADYLCCDRSALSAQLAVLQKEGVLTYNKNRFRLFGNPEK